MRSLQILLLQCKWKALESLLVFYTQPLSISTRFIHESFESNMNTLDVSYIYILLRYSEIKSLKFLQLRFTMKSTFSPRILSQSFLSFQYFMFLLTSFLKDSSFSQLSGLSISYTPKFIICLGFYRNVMPNKGDSFIQLQSFLSFLR